MWSNRDVQTRPRGGNGLVISGPKGDVIVVEKLLYAGRMGGDVVVLQWHTVFGINKVPKLTATSVHTSQFHQLVYQGHNSWGYQNSHIMITGTFPVSTETMELSLIAIFEGSSSLTS